MKRTQRLLTLFIFAALICTMTVACVNKPQYDGGAIVLITISQSQSGGLVADAAVIDEEGAKTEYSVTTTAEFIGGVIDQFVEQGLVLSTTDSEYGKMIQKIGYVDPDASAGEYVAFYTTSQSLEHSMLEFSVTVDGIEYYSCNWGIDSMPVISGVSYLFTIGVFVA